MEADTRRVHECYSASNLRLNDGIPQQLYFQDTHPMSADADQCQWYLLHEHESFAYEIFLCYTSSIAHIKTKKVDDGRCLI